MTLTQWIAKTRLDSVVIAAQENARRREAARHLMRQAGAVLHVMYSEPRTLAVDEYCAASEQFFATTKWER